MKNGKIVESIANRFLRFEKENIETQLPPHATDQFDLLIKGMPHHLHYKVETNSSEGKIYFSTFYAFYTRENITKIKHWVGKKIGEIKKDPLSSIQMIYISRDTGNLVITQAISIKEKTKKEMKEKISFLLEQMEKYWPFKY